MVKDLIMQLLEKWYLIIIGIVIGLLLFVGMLCSRSYIDLNMQQINGDKIQLEIREISLLKSEMEKDDDILMIDNDTLTVVEKDKLAKYKSLELERNILIVKYMPEIVLISNSDEMLNVGGDLSKPVLIKKFVICGMAGVLFVIFVYSVYYLFICNYSIKKGEC